jgi:hypothetical protein
MKQWLGEVIQACNPSYLGGRYKEDGFEASSDKKFVRPHLNQQLAWLVHTCYPRYTRKDKQEDHSSG